MKISCNEWWVSKKDKKGAWSPFLKELFQYIQNEDFSFDIFEKGHILRPFSGKALSKLKKISTNFNGSIYAYRVFYIPIFRRKKFGPKRVKILST